MKIEIPKNCPSCGSLLELVNGQLFCRNKTNCPAQSSKLVENFCSKMKLKGFGPQTISKLGLNSISSLFFVTDDELKNAVGEKVATKLSAELNQKLRSDVDFGQVLGSLGIPLIGEVAARKLSQSASNFNDVKATGKAGENYNKWINSDLGKDVISLPWKFNSKLTGSNPTLVIYDTVKPNGVTVCITGSLNDYANRSEATLFLESKGFIVKKSVTKDVNYLICEDESKKSSSSYKKAIASGVAIITIKELLENINNE